MTRLGYVCEASYGAVGSDYIKIWRRTAEAASYPRTAASTQP